MMWGYPDGYFRGDKALSRAEALIILQNCFEQRPSMLVNQKSSKVKPWDFRS